MNTPTLASRQTAFVLRGTFYCTCGAHHSRGPIDGVDHYRCLACGRVLQSYRFNQRVAPVTLFITKNKNNDIFKSTSFSETVATQPVTTKFDLILGI
jgi:hypothetical protein